LATLQSDLAKGEARLRQLDEERSRLRDQLLRIDGAITALVEVAGAFKDPNGGPADVSNTPAANDPAAGPPG
jgi:hypothetical protein